MAGSFAIRQSKTILARSCEAGGDEPIWIADTHRHDGKSFVVRADEELTAFIELESAIRSINGHDRAAVPV